MEKGKIIESIQQEIENSTQDVVKDGKVIAKGDCLNFNKKLRELLNKHSETQDGKNIIDEAFKKFKGKENITEIDAIGTDKVKLKYFPVLNKEDYPSLEKVWCTDNQLTELYLLGVKKVYCPFNKLTTLVCPCAETIWCNNNELGSREAPYGATLDIKNVKTLYCQNNKLERLTLSEVKYLNCSNNNLSVLTCVNVEDLECCNNKLEKLFLPKARTIDCSNNILKKITCKKAYKLVCHGNFLKKEMISAPQTCDIDGLDEQRKVTRIEVVEIQDEIRRSIKDVERENQPTQKGAQLLFNDKLRNLINKNSQTKEGRESIDEAFNKLDEKMRFKIKNIQCPGVEFKTKENFQSARIEKIKLKYFPKLEENSYPSLESLNCGENELEELFVPDAKGHVSCSENKLTKIHCPEVKSLSCSDNNLTGKLYLKYATSVTCNNNEIIDLNLPNAKYVSANKNKLKRLHCPKATTINCNENELDGLDFGDQPIEILSCYKNELRTLICRGVTENLICSHNKLTELDCPNLEGSIDCSYNELIRFTCPKATGGFGGINCSHNKLEELKCPEANDMVTCNDNELVRAELPKAKLIFSRNNYLNKNTLIAPNAEEIHGLDSQKKKKEEVKYSEDMFSPPKKVIPLSDDDEIIPGLKVRDLPRNIRFNSMKLMTITREECEKYLKEKQERERKKKEEERQRRLEEERWRRQERLRDTNGFYTSGGKKDRDCSLM